jgi:hexulose-6-phosphate isomerase
MAAAGMARRARAQEGPNWKKAVVAGMLPGGLEWSERFALARECGYHGIEMPPMDDHDLSAELAGQAEEAGVELHSVIYGGWGAPLSSADAETIEKGQRSLEQALHQATVIGASTVLLVPAVVNENTRYAHAYDRSQENLKPLIPVAEELGVTIAIENVWNNFLLSPIEMARYVDEMDSPRVKAYFDCGNIVKYGWPEDWILTLGERIDKVHLKDYSRADGWKMLREGDVNWPRVTDALKEIGYEGYFTCELGGGDEEYLKDVSQRVDLILAGE